MVNSKPQTVVLRGEAMYAKILGDPVLNYNKDGKEWKMDFKLADKNSIKELDKLGIKDRVKTKDGYLDGEPFMTFKQAEFRKDGVTPNQPIKVVDIAGKEWSQEKLIGNGSKVDVKFVVMDFGPGKKKGVYIRSVRVLDLVPYEKDEFPEIDENDEFFDNLPKEEQILGEVGNVEELDDEMPL